MGALIRSVKFLSPEVALYLYKATIRPCMEYCCHVCAGAPDATWKRLINYKNRYAGLLVLHLLPVLNPWLIVEMQPAKVFSVGINYFGRCSSELVQLVPLPFSWGRSTRCSDKLHDVSITIPRSYKDIYSNSFFPGTSRVWNSLPRECFHLTYGLNGLKSGISRHLLTVGSF